MAEENIRSRGVVVRFNEQKGYGFIKPDGGGDDLFVHHTEATISSFIIHRYAFKTSLTDIPLVSVIRSLLITCVYSMCDGPALSHGPYLGTVALSSFVSILLLSVKACVFSVNSQIEAEASSSLSKQKLHLKKSWGMPVLFLSFVVFALGHIVIAY